ncbi:hypothetical protein EKO17_23960 [Enterobacter hormaechei subsp. xiangfangensis]|nr:hypothetical protein EKO17_23960 [Enterobacter hormaechei subsp. xiangfangensis]
MLIIETPNFKKLRIRYRDDFLFRVFCRCHDSNIKLFLVSKAITLVNKLFNPFDNINNTLVLAGMFHSFTII